MSDIHFHALGSARARSGEDPLVPFLLSARNGPVTVSARDVRRLLLVAERQWAVDDVTFKLTDMSPSFRDGLQRLGLDANYFDKEIPQ